MDLIKDFLCNYYCSIDEPSGTGGGAGQGDAGSGSTPNPSATGEPVPASPPTPLGEDRVNAMIEQALQPYRDRIADLQSTNVIMQGMLRDRQPATPAAPAEPAAPTLPDKDRFIEAMNADPAGTILDLVRRHISPEVDSKVSGAVQGVRNEGQARDTMARAIADDQRAALEVATQWDEQSPERQLFDTYGEEELLRLCPTTIVNGKRMPDPRVFRPGMLEQAALRAERRMRAEGKVASTPQPTNANAARNIVQFPRASRSSVGAPSGAEPTAPKSIDDLVSQGKLTSDEAAIAKRNCKRWDMTEERFVYNWLESVKENSHYGTGL